MSGYRSRSDRCECLATGLIDVSVWLQVWKCLATGLICECLATGLEDVSYRSRSLATGLIEMLQV